MSGRANRKLPLDAAESEAHRMRGNSMRGNRETPESPTADGAAGRPEKADGRASGMYGCGESDDLIVPGKRANKAGHPAAEPVEGSGSTKGNALHPTAQRTQSRASASSGLHRVRQAARRDKGVRFTALLHHVTPELLRASFYALNRRACPGVDGMTWREYERGLADRLADLHGRVHRGSYRAKPSRRAWIPKADGRRRPLGIAALEDKIVQQAVRTVLDEIYEEDFLGFTHVCEEDEKGRFSVRRQTMAHRMRATVEAIKAQLRRRMHQPIREVGRWLGTVMRGWMNYHAVPGNRERLWQFRTEVTRHWRHVLRRRSQKAAKKWTWARLTREFKRWLPRLVIVHPDPGERFDRTHPR